MSRLSATVAGVCFLVCAPDVADAAPLSIPYQLTYAVNADPSFSPDGRKMVFITVVSGVEQLFIADSDAKHAVQITTDPVDHEDPAWSPDGRKIAFVSTAKDHETIYTMNADGSAWEAMTPPDQRAIHPSWSRDGSEIIYCTDDDLAPPRKNDADIIVVDVKTKARKTLITGGVNTYPTWSPDMKTIAYRHMIGEMNSEIFAADSDGSHIRNLTNHPAFDGWPAWSPDGKRIAFASNRNSSYQIFVMDSDGANVALVANTEGRATAPRWSLDGNAIYFTNCQHRDYGVDCQIMVAKL
jgi:TolB protein